MQIFIIQNDTRPVIIISQLAPISYVILFAILHAVVVAEVLLCSITV